MKIDVERVNTIQKITNEKQTIYNKYKKYS